MSFLSIERVRRMHGMVSSSVLLLYVLQLPSAAQSVEAATSDSLASGLRYGFPGRRVGSGSRCPDCIGHDQVAQTLLVPENNLLLTEEASPTLLFYLPAIQDARTVRLLVIGPNGEAAYVAETSRENEIAGVVRLDLSAVDEPPVLELGRTYRWYLTIVCGLDKPDKSLSTAGAIIRIDDMEVLTEANGEDSSALSASTYSMLRNLDVSWYQDLNNLDLARRDLPNDPTIENQWGALLAEVGLDWLAEANPIEFTFDTLP